MKNFHPLEPKTYSAPIVVGLLSRLGLLDNVSSVLDLGCNNGQWLKSLEEVGIGDTVGVDGGGIEDHKWFKGEFIEHDLTKPLDLKRKFDLVVCVEVAEHLPGVSANVLIETINVHARDKVIWSAAPPGQTGFGHINLRPLSYWEDKFSRIGFTFNLGIRKALPPEVSWWIRNNLVIAIREPQ